MQLSFYARAGHVVQWPGVKRAGSLPDYVGRTNVEIKGSGWAHPATDEAVKVDSESQAGRRFAKLVRRDESLWPADKATADACQVPFVELELVGGEFAPKTHAKVAKKGGN